ncbi:unnamed protein product [Parajaminaea phylloscopi]
MPPAVLLSGRLPGKLPFPVGPSKGTDMTLPRSGASHLQGPTPRGQMHIDSTWRFAAHSSAAPAFALVAMPPPCHLELSRTTAQMESGAIRQKRSRSEDGDEQGPRGQASTSVVSLSQPTTIYRRKKRSSAKNLDLTSAPWTSFPRLSDHEATDTPRRLRRDAYLRANAWIDEQYEAAVERLYDPLIDPLSAWLQRVGQDALWKAREPRRGMRTTSVPVAAISSTAGDDKLFGVVKERLGRSSNSHGTLLASASRADLATQSAGQLVEFFCSQWLSTMTTEGYSIPALGPTGAWSELCRRLGSACDSRKRPILLLVLPDLPRCPLFSTLHYLLNLPAGPETLHTTLAVVLKTSSGPNGLDTLAWDQKRFLDIECFEPPRCNIQEFIVALSSHADGAAHLPAGLLRHACKAIELSFTESEHDLSRLKRWLQLAIILHTTQHAIASLSSPLDDEQPQAADYTSQFWNDLRLQLVACVEAQGTSKMDFCASGLPDRDVLRKVMEDDEALLRFVLNRGRSRQGPNTRLIGMKLMAAMPHADASAAVQYTEGLSALRFALALSTRDVRVPRLLERENAVLREGLKQLLTPVLSSIRRSETEMGALSVKAVELWLEQAEDTVVALREGVTPVPGGELDSLLQDIRGFQQALSHAASSKTQNTHDSHDTAAPGAASSDEVSQRLMREEKVRETRKQIADWLGSTTRRLLLPPGRLELDRIDSEQVLQLSATVNTLLDPSPRAELTLALAKPSIYLEHFALSAHASLVEESSTSSADELAAKQTQMQRLARMLANKQARVDGGDRLQTDLSIAYNLLREAGGLGTGVKGRVINVLDWFHAWTLGASVNRGADTRTTTNGTRSAASGAKEQDQGPLQARFALCLSELALLGYIKRTRKGNGQGVLKVGGWDMVPGQDQDQISGSATETQIPVVS